MTSAQSMQPGSAIRRLRAAALLALIALVLGGCDSGEKLQDPVRLRSPYARPMIWAVAPLNNESGVSAVKPDQVADRFAEEIEQIDGIEAVPVNMVLKAMRQLQMRSIASPADARSVMNTLGVDGIIVGSITAYDPYPPPKFGASILLYRRDAPGAGGLDPVALTRAPNEKASPGGLPDDAPAAQASGVYDGRDHQTLAQLHVYASGRIEPGSAFGERIYLNDMDLYTQFAAHRLLDDLLASESIRRRAAETEQEKR